MERIAMHEPANHHPDTWSVVDLRQNDSARVCKLTGDRGMLQRLAMLGIRRGIGIRVVHGPGKRGAILQVGGARIALGWDVIQHIEVERLGIDPHGTGEPS